MNCVHKLAPVSLNQLIAQLLLSALAAVLLVGCTAEEKPAARSATNKVTIRGSNTVGEELAPRLIAAYQAEHPDAEFDLESKGTGFGFGNLLAGGCDIAAASRKANEDDIRLARARDIELSEMIIGAYAEAVVVHPSNPVAELTHAQVRELFTGAVTNWSQLGGASAPVNLYIRDPISGTYLGFRELAMDNNPYGEAKGVLPSYRAITTSVADDPNGIGYSSLLAVREGGVKILKIGGTELSQETVFAGEYPISRVLRFYTRQGQVSQPALDFLEFVASEKGQETVAKAGFIPRPEVAVADE